MTIQLFESDVKDIEKAYKDLAAAAAVYDEKIYTDFYWRYEKAMKDAKQDVYSEVELS